MPEGRCPLSDFRLDRAPPDIVLVRSPVHRGSDTPSLVNGHGSSIDHDELSRTGVIAHPMRRPPRRERRPWSDSQITT